MQVANLTSENTALKDRIETLEAQVDSFRRGLMRTHIEKEKDSYLCVPRVSTEPQPEPNWAALYPLPGVKPKSESKKRKMIRYACASLTRQDVPMDKMIVLHLFYTCFTPVIH